MSTSIGSGNSSGVIGQAQTLPRRILEKLGLKKQENPVGTSPLAAGNIGGSPNISGSPDVTTGLSAIG